MTDNPKTLSERLLAELSKHADPDDQAAIIMRWAKWEVDLASAPNRGVVEVIAKRMKSRAPRIREAVAFAICSYARVPGYEHLAIHAWEGAEFASYDWSADAVASYARHGYDYSSAELVRILRPILTQAAQGQDRVQIPETEESIAASLRYLEFWNAAHSILDALWAHCSDGAPDTTTLFTFERDLFRIGWMLSVKAGEPPSGWPGPSAPAAAAD